jgi:uncharacterized protein YjbI with pentapeptide repeats
MIIFSCELFFLQSPSQVLSNSSQSSLSLVDNIYRWLYLLLNPFVTICVSYFITTRITNERNKQDALKSYLKEITNLLLDKELKSKTNESNEVQAAKSTTVLVLRELDLKRKKQLIQFLSDAKLIQSEQIGLLKGAYLEDIFLKGVYLNEAYMEDIKLKKSNLSESFLQGVNLTGAKLSRTKFYKANLKKAVLRHADLTGADLIGADLTGADLTGALLLNANLTKTKLSGSNLTKAKLKMANLEEAILDDANLTEAILEQSQLVGTAFNRAKLLGSKCKGVSLEKCGSIADTSLKYSDLSGATIGRLDGCIDLRWANLTSARFVNNLHSNNNSIKLRFSVYDKERTELSNINPKISGMIKNSGAMNKIIKRLKPIFLKLEVWIFLFKKKMFDAMKKLWRCRF